MDDGPTGHGRRVYRSAAVRRSVALTSVREADFTGYMGEAKTYAGGCHCGKAIDVRCLDGVDIGALKPTPDDGRSR